MQINNTTILSENIRLHLDSSDLNNNVLVNGSAGTGKTIGFVHPNLMQVNTNYIVMDFRRDLYEIHADLLRQKGYNVMQLDFEDMTGSHYNPLHYIHKDDFETMEKEVLGLVNVICANTNDVNCDHNDPCAEHTEQIIFATLLLHCIIKHGANVSFKDVFDLYDTFEADDMSEFTKLMNGIRETHPESSIANDTDFHEVYFRGSIISIGYRLMPFRMYYEREIYRKAHENNPWNNYHDTLNLETFGNEKNAIFVTAPMDTRMMHALVSLFIWQSSQILMNYENKQIIRFMLDECSNIGCIPNLSMFLSNAMTHNISYNLMIQTICQLKDWYPNEWQQIIAACDTMLACGCYDNDEAYYLSQLTGKTTILDPPEQPKKRNWFQRLFSKPKKTPETKLRTVVNMRPESIRLMNRDQCLVFQKGCDARLDTKCKDGYMLLQQIYENKKKQYDRKA